MCLSVKSDQPDTSSDSQTRSILGLGVLMLVACLAGPTIAGLVVALAAGAF
jgi:hypothetical protein